MNAKLPAQTTLFPNETLTGLVERVTFYNSENGYSVLKIKPDRKYPKAMAKDGTLAVVGSMPAVGVGERIEFTGFWIEDPRYGTQFRAETVTMLPPTTEEGIIAFLASGIVPGIGDKTAERIVKKFGDKTLHILENDPERLKEVIKPNLADKLAVAWRENLVTRQTMIFLQGYGVTSRMSKRIIEQYGPDTINQVKNDPFALADEVYGIGFIRADEIARSMGVEPDAHVRLRAGLHYALNHLAKEGHTYASRAALMAKTAELLKVENSTRIELLIGQQLFTGDLLCDEPAPANMDEQAIYLPLYYYSEKNAAYMLRQLSKTRSPIMDKAKSIKWPQFLKKLVEDDPVSLTEQQMSAVKAAFTHKLSILTGGPGTGKTTTLKMVIAALEEQEFEYALASPTGRAAKRLAEATGKPASTLHRLLGYSPSEGFTHDEDDPLKVDMLIVDESSMIDLLLFNDMLKALPPETHLLLVGDMDQLPSVGAGNVLRDVIESGVAHVTRLEVIFRQREDSHIVVNAHRINGGDQPHMDNRSADFFFFPSDDPVEAASLVVDIVKNRLPNRFGIDPVNDVQVLAPMYRGPVGVSALNDALQAALNGDPRMAELKYSGRTFRTGDKVMQTRNNYDKEVFNGDIGRVYAVDRTAQRVEVVIDERIVEYEGHEIDELFHAYCISTHRSQGSEYPVVVMPIMKQHYMMLQRNLLYTAVTRAKQVVVLVGHRHAVQMAVNNNKVAERFSGLLGRLKG